MRYEVLVVGMWSNQSWSRHCVAGFCNFEHSRSEFRDHIDLDWHGDAFDVFSLWLIGSSSWTCGPISFSVRCPLLKLIAETGSDVFVYGFVKLNRCKTRMYAPAKASGRCDMLFSREMSTLWTQQLVMK